jgi:excisionase family DNA binding protein
MMKIETSDSTPAVSLRAEDQTEIVELYKKLQRSGRAQLVSPEGEARALPDSLYQFLVELLAVLREARCVTIVENQAKLTTVEAAALLGVSRQFLVNLLENNEIPFHRVGTRRRIYAADLLAYKGQRDRMRSKLIRDLAAAEDAEGLYDRQPSDGD